MTPTELKSWLCVALVLIGAQKGAAADVSEVGTAISDCDGWCGGVPIFVCLPKRQMDPQGALPIGLLLQLPHWLMPGTQIQFRTSTWLTGT